MRRSLTCCAAVAALDSASGVRIHPAGRNTHARASGGAGRPGPPDRKGPAVSSPRRAVPSRARAEPTLGPRDGVHVEVFAANRVVILPAGIGTKPPRTMTAGRITSARCYGDLVTLDPTGLVLVRPGTHATTQDLFRAWGEPLSNRRLASFEAAADGHVAVFVDGRRWPGPRKA